MDEQPEKIKNIISGFIIIVSVATTAVVFIPEITGNIYGEFTFQGPYVYQVTLKDGFELLGRITHLRENDMIQSGFYPEYSSTIVRSLYIEDTLYTISESMINVHSLDDLKELALISLE
jgi:hypothetical protein